MSFQRGFGSGRPVPPAGSQRRRKDGPVLAVGWRVVVAGPAGGAGTVTLTADDDSTVVGAVEAGVEVEILAWRPHGADGPRYRVLASGAGSEGWLGAASLVPCRRPAPPAAVAPSVDRSAPPARSPRGTERRKTRTRTKRR
jgi:hypothetical protein